MSIVSVIFRDIVMVIVMYMISDGVRVTVIFTVITRATVIDMVHCNICVRVGVNAIFIANSTFRYRIRSIASVCTMVSVIVLLHVLLMYGLT